MKMTNAAIYDVIETLRKFNNAKGKTAFVIFRTLRKLQEEIKDCDEQKNALIQKYGKEVEGGIAIPKDDVESYEKFMKEFTPILFYQIDVDIPKITEEEFEALSEIEAPDAGVNDYAIIDAFLVDHKVVEKKDEAKVEGKEPEKEAE